MADPDDDRNVPSALHRRICSIPASIQRQRPKAQVYNSVYKANFDKHLYETLLDRCYVDQCDSDASQINETWVDFALPKGN